MTTEELRKSIIEYVEKISDEIYTAEIRDAQICLEAFSFQRIIHFVKTGEDSTPWIREPSDYELELIEKLTIGTRVKFTSKVNKNITWIGAVIGFLKVQGDDSVEIKWDDLSGSLVASFIQLARDDFEMDIEILSE